jgi:membrane fusion protein (multidrug efflux system)
VKLHADLYGKSVTYTGRVAGLGAGTGAAFALLPAQNATGNWIKVVQRVPVRIELDAAPLQDHPLRVGLSMDVEVDVSAKPEAAPLMAAPASVTPAASATASATASSPATATVAAAETPVSRSSLPTRRSNQTSAFATPMAEADALVQRIIHRNLGRSGPAPATTSKPGASSKPAAQS